MVEHLVQLYKKLICAQDISMFSYGNVLNVKQQFQLIKPIIALAKKQAMFSRDM